MHRQIKNSILGLLILIAIQVAACERNTEEDHDLTESIQNFESNIIAWPVSIQEDTISLAGSIELEEIATVQASEMYFTKPRGFIAADSTGFVITGIWTPQGVETRAYDWNASLLWIEPDTLCVGGMPPTLGAITIRNEKIYVSIVSHRVLVLDRASGEQVSELTFPGEEELSNGAPFLHATSFAMGDSLYAFGWFSWIPGLEGICATVYDVDRKELFSIENNPDDYRGKLSECRVACSNNTVYFSSVAEDRIYSISEGGEVLACFTSGHTVKSELERPSTEGEPVLFPVTGALQFVFPDHLWILYGSGAFESDSSEIWQVNLSSGEAYKIALSNSAISFSVWDDNIAIVYRGNDADSVTSDFTSVWSSDDNYIQTGRLNYETESH